MDSGKHDPRGRWRIAPQWLGWPVLGFAVLSFTGILSFGKGWEGTLGALVWPLYVVGGLALVFAKSWGRTFVVLGSAASLIVVFAGILKASETESVLLGPGDWFWIIVLGVMPAVVILAAALLVRFPPSPDPAEPPTNARRTFHDVAYMAFVFLGLVAWYVAYLQWDMYLSGVESVSSGVQVLAMMVLLWFGLPLLILLPVALVLSLVFWRDWRLPTMSLFTLALLTPMLGLTGQEQSTWTLNPWPTTAYGAASLLFALYWFFRARKAYELAADEHGV